MPQPQPGALTPAGGAVGEGVEQSRITSLLLSIEYSKGGAERELGG